MSSDPELLRRYTHESSQEAFTELVQRHIDFVYATALRQAGSDARAKDVTQAVFTDLAKKAAQLAARNDLVGWLHTSTRYAVATLRRSEARREEREQKAHPMHDDFSTTHDQIDWDKLRPLLDDALHALGERDREAILLRYFKQCSFSEIGATLGLSEEATRKRIDRGVEKLRSHLAKRGIVSTLVALELAMASQAALAAPAGFAATVATTSLATAAQATTFLAQLLGGIKIAAVATSIVTAIGSGSIVAWKANTTRETESSLYAEKQKISRMEAERNQLLRRLTELEQIRESKRQTLATLKITIAAKIQRMSPKFKGEAIVEALLRLNLDDEMKKVLEKIEPILFSNQNFYGPLFTKFHYTPKQIETFFACLRGDNPFVPSYKFIDEGNEHGRFTLSLDWGNMKIDENKFKEFFGEAGLNEYKEEWRTITIRTQIVNVLASSLVYTDAPLDAAVSRQLTQILANATSDPTSPAATDIDWKKALQEAKTILSPVQLKALARLQGNLSDSITWSYAL
ncbi:MAG: sigma-70 family RNA polymerase sigma factor [Nibricoccus sp.]